MQALRFDSDNIPLCKCGNQSLFITFFANGDWIVNCACGRYRPKTWPFW